MGCKFVKHDGFEAVCTYKGNKAKNKALSVRLCLGLPDQCPWHVLKDEKAYPKTVVDLCKEE
jgi:hypothetical protein